MSFVLFDSSLLSHCADLVRNLIKFWVQRFTVWFGIMTSNHAVYVGFYLVMPKHFKFTKHFKNVKGEGSPQNGHFHYLLTLM